MSFESPDWDEEVSEKDSHEGCKLVLSIIAMLLMLLSTVIAYYWI